MAAAVALMERFDAFDDAAFARWQDLLESRLGLTLPANRQLFLVTRLRTRMREIGLLSFDDYYARLQQQGSAVEWATLIDRLTVHETRFFRHGPSMQLVAEQARHASAHFHAWSVGCSTGEEAYSLAMQIDSTMDDAEERYWGVTATDVSQPALSIARDGRYASDRLGELPKWAKTFCEHDRDGLSFRVQRRLRQRIGFAAANLLAIDTMPLRDMQLIYCQNVLIYFSIERRRKILNALADRLAVDGMLILGPGELTGFSHPKLRRVKRDRVLAYQRLDADKGHS